MKTYKQHYQACKENHTSGISIYDLTYKLNDISYNENNFNKLKKILKHRLSYRIGCIEEQWSTYLNDIKDITELSNFLNDIIPQIENKTAGCYLKAEHVHVYENKKNVSLESSWAWHYDDCPAEFIKFAIYLNDVNEDNGPMQIIPEVIESYRVSPDSVKGKPPPVFPKSRIPKEYIEGKKPIVLCGEAGTNFIFTPNIIHRGTVPKKNTMNRMALFVFLRPSLRKIENYLKEASCYLPKRNVKVYELN